MITNNERRSTLHKCRFKTTPLAGDLPQLHTQALLPYRAKFNEIDSGTFLRAILVIGKLRRALSGRGRPKTAAVIAAKERAQSQKATARYL